MRVSQSCMKMYSDVNYFWDKSMLWPNNDDLILAGIMFVKNVTYLEIEKS